MSRKIKSISFNLNDPFELEMYEYSLKFSNFSSFIKRLIHRSINGKSVNNQTATSVSKVETVQTNQFVINHEYLKQLI